ncbi:MAG: hypothetical protein WCK26_04240 [Candidatus Saccharibacteria bacterium]
MEVFVVFGAKMAGYESCGYFARGLNIISIVLQSYCMRLNKYFKPIREAANV